MNIEEYKQKKRDYMKARRAAAKENGIKLPSDTIRDPEKERERARLAQRERRANAKHLGIVLPSDDWHIRNPDKHRQRVRNWRANNIEYSQEINRKNQAKRRSTPWGRINNCVWPIMHGAVRLKSNRETKYTRAMGHTWADLAEHLENQFTPEMNWENWGSVWELDHIIPVSSFKYETIDDPLFRECWSLSNLRPLLREENQRKAAK